MKYCVCAECITKEGEKKYQQVQELIMCKDCKHSDMEQTGFKHYYCSKHNEYHHGDYWCGDGYKNK